MTQVIDLVGVKFVLLRMVLDFFFLLERNVFGRR